MLRQKLVAHYERAGRAVRFRNREISRLEGLSDAVFGFAITLLIVSLEVPKTSSELIATMRGFVAFAFTFFILFTIWYRQFSFFRRYGLEDKVAIALNGALLFVVLFFIYPLKFLATWIAGRLMGGGKSIVLANGTLERILKPEHIPWLFGIYGCGFAAVFAVFALLYRHALSKSDELGLSDLERFETRQAVKLNGMVAGLGLLVAVSGTAAQLENSTGPLRYAGDVVGIITVVGVVVLMRLRMRSRRQQRAMESLAS
ncbi:MAG: TMEM175 family protein [Gemmatimonadaceae bacterium]